MTKTLEQKIEFANSIDFSGLFSHAEKLAGFSLTFEKTVNEINGYACVDFRSNDIAASCGLFGKIIEFCIIDNFGGHVVEDKETGELYYWGNAHLSYRHYHGGSNGMELFSARYINGEWTFEDVGPRG